jgi:hypothetical protein
LKKSNYSLTSSQARLTSSSGTLTLASQNRKEYFVKQKSLHLRLEMSRVEIDSNESISAFETDPTRTEIQGPNPLIFESSSIPTQ